MDLSSTADPWLYIYYLGGRPHLSYRHFDVWEESKLPGALEVDDVQELIAVTGSWSPVAGCANTYSFVILLSSSITLLVVRTSPKNKRVFIKVTSRKISSKVVVASDIRMTS